ncbi:MAG: sulfotransferase [Nocardioides sp.]
MVTAGPETFVLGLGAQKAGTTWLSHFLNSSPQFDRGYRKEYHVFDTLDLPEHGRRMRRRNLRLAREALDAAEAGEPADADVVHRMAMTLDPAYYFDYFAGLLRRPGIDATGDLTPNYALLSAERVASIRAGFAERGVRTVAVFLMRDPVERVWSHVRMRHDREPSRFAARDLTDELREHHAEPNYADVTRYEATLDTIEAVFAPDEVYVGLYEHLFNDAGPARAICDLVGIAAPEPELDRRSNAASRPSTDLDADTARVVAEHFAATYREVAARHPDLDVAQWWPHAAHVLGR